MNHSYEMPRCSLEIIRSEPQPHLQARAWSFLVGATLLMSAAFGAVAADSGAITTASLIKEMTDLAGMAEFPKPAYTCKQFSSYDRKSKSPANPTQEDWFANGDAASICAWKSERAARST